LGTDPAESLLLLLTMRCSSSSSKSRYQICEWTI
jgi:hypothetical protein